MGPLGYMENIYYIGLFRQKILVMLRLIMIEILLTEPLLVLA
jgi:hypothetical protein